MGKAGTTPTGDEGVYTAVSQDRGLTLVLSELTWETEFFGRRFARLVIDAEETRDFDAEGLAEPLQEVLSYGDRNGIDLIELELDVSWIHHSHLFEESGFRLVDTKLRFVTLKQREGMEGAPPQKEDIAFVSPDMKDELLDLTHKAFTDNPSFKSRYTNKRFFSRSETERYYEAWIENYMEDGDALFAVMRDQGKIVGYLVYAKTGEHEGKPLYKAGLAAVAPGYRGRGIYFSLGSFIYRNLPESEVYLDMTTQLSNLSTMRNLIKAQRRLDRVQLVFYRRREDAPAAKPV